MGILNNDLFYQLNITSILCILYTFAHYVYSAHFCAFNNMNILVRYKNVLL